MKRHPAFQDLSRDHYVALNRVLQVLRSVEGHPMAKPYEESLDALRRLWTQDGLPGHFEEEEADLLPILQARNPSLSDRLLREHAELRARLGQLQGLARAEVAGTATLLRAHVRWEEDTMFPWLQDNLGEAELQALLAKSQAFRQKNRLPAACEA